MVHTQQNLITESLTLLASTLMARVCVPSVCLACVSVTEPSLPLPLQYGCGQSAGWRW